MPTHNLLIQAKHTYHGKIAGLLHPIFLDFFQDPGLL